LAAPSHVPPFSRREELIETLHGKQIADPFRWLEDGKSAETQAWVEAQNAFTRSLLDEIPSRSAIAARLGELLAIGDVSAPSPRRGQYFFLRREGDENHSVLFVRDGQDGPERELINPNAIDADGLVALDWWYASPDGSFLAYGLSHGGDEESTLHVLEVRSGADLSDMIAHARAASLAWLSDSSGFYYTRYPAAGEVPPGEELYHRSVYLHRLGADPAADERVFGEDRAPEDWPSVLLSPDGRYLLVTVNRGWDCSDCYLRDESRPDRFIPIIEGERVLSDGEVVGETLYLRTDLDAANYRLLAVDVADPRREHWKELIPERQDAVLEQARVIGGRLLLVYLQDASCRLETAALDGSDLRPIPLPSIGTVQEITGEWDGVEAFFSFSSFATPRRVYRYGVRDSGMSLWTAVDAHQAGEDFEVHRDRCISRDGTPIPLFVVHRRGLSRDGHNPTVLTGYGGFNISMTPAFSRSLLFWLEQGGVYAVANLRGGGEFGEKWHRGGMLANKQNVFDDFIAAAEHLCEMRYTNRGSLALSGGSNGGLLVGAAITQRPALCRAAICAVPLLDMLRYHRFRIARLWTAEYGCADDPAQFRWLVEYSPYQHVTPGTPYPAVLFLTGDGDSRVDPLHARKMAARLQTESGSGLPVLLRLDRDSGHGAGRPLAKTLAEQTDVWTFLCWQLGLSVDRPAPFGARRG